MSVEGPKSVARELAEHEDPRQLAGRVVNAIYRLIKGCFLHDDANQALTGLIELVIESTHQFCEKAGVESAAVLFAGNSVFVNKQMLRASRETYQLALELGTILAGCNVTEVTLERGVLAVEVAEFGRAVAAMHREKKLSPKFTEGGWTGLKVRKVVGFGGSEVLSPVTRVARTYAASIMIVRAFYADLKKGKFELSHSVKRVAQKLAGIPEDEKRLLLSTAAAPAADTDRAGLIVSSAIVAVVMAGQLTDDRSALTSLATAALLYDAGRARLTRGSGTDGPPIERVLNEEEEERLPNASVIALTVLGKLHPPSVTRSVIVYEALALRNEATTPYGGARQPHVLSRILATARAFTELRVARGASPPLSIDDAIQVLSSQARDNTEKTFVKLLVGTLGVFPAGTLVELSTGELAVVVSTPRLPVDFARPPVRIMYDPNGALLEEPIDLDLATAKHDEEGQRRFILKPIDASDQQMKQMRAYVMSLTAKRKRSSDKNRIDKAQLDAAKSEAKPKIDRPPPRRRLSAPQADIPAAVRAHQERERQKLAVDIVHTPTEAAPPAPAVEAEPIVDDGWGEAEPEVEVLPGLSKPARAPSEPELSFEPIELHQHDARPAPAAAPAPAPAPASSSASPVLAARESRAAVKRWDPRSEEEPPADAAPPPRSAEPAKSAPVPPSASPASVAKPPTPRPVAASPSALVAKRGDERAGPAMRPTPSVPMPAVVVKEAGEPAAAKPGARPPLVAKVTTELVIPAPPPDSQSGLTPSRRSSGSTRQVSWTEYGKEIVEAVGVPEPSPSETDAILAAYLSEDASAEPAEPNEAQSRSAGLRWGPDASSSGGHATGGNSTSGHSTGGHSTGGHSTGGHSTGGHSTGGHSTGGHSTGGASSGGHVTGAARQARATNTAGLRWEGRSSAGASSSAGRDMAASSPGREVGASSPGRDVRSSGGVGWASSGGGREERPTPVSRQGGEGAPASTTQPTTDGAPSLRGRAKAGSQAWGNPKRDKK